MELHELMSPFELAKLDRKALKEFAEALGNVSGGLFLTLDEVLSDKAGKRYCQELMRSHFVVSLGEADAVGKVQRWLAQFFQAKRDTQFVLMWPGLAKASPAAFRSAHASSSRRHYRECWRDFRKER